MRHRTRMISVAAGLMLLAGCNGGVETPPPSPGPSSVTTPGASPSPAPSPSPTSEEDVAVAEAISTYKQYTRALHAMSHAGGSQESLEAVLVFTTEDGSARGAAISSAELFREEGLSSTGWPEVKRASSTDVDLAAGRITLATCLDLRDVTPVGEGEFEEPEFFVERPEMHSVDGRWLVADVPGEHASC